MSSLIETISSDAVLAARLAAMPADSKTLTLELGHGMAMVHHPEWVGDASLAGDAAPTVKPRETAGGKNGAAATRQTIDLPPPDATCRAAEGFVPARRIATWCSPGTGSSDDVEYRLVGKLGSGGTGVVYQAHQRAIDREVAVKVLRHELACDPASRQRFLAEARVIGALDHPNVIALHDLCLDDEGRLFYAMKRVDGASWDHQIATMTVDQNVDVLLRVADAIRYAHSRGLIHRDLKPENLMLGRFGEVLVADWGLAISRTSQKDPGDRPTGLTESAIGGTPAYMAPEQAMGDLAAIDFSTDVYLLGAILFQILTGQPPHHGESLLQCIRNAADNVMVEASIESELLDVAMQAMATLPADRFASVEDFIAAVHNQRTHAESERLARRAAKVLTQPDPADDVNPYRRFRVAEALLREAIEVWPGNRRAASTLTQTQAEFARTAAAHGDLDLSLLLYEAAGLADSEAAALVRFDREQRASVSASQAKYSTLFTHSPDAGLLIRWSDGMVMEANLSCVELLGYEESELVGRTMASLQIWECPSRRRLFVDQLGRDGRIDNFEAQFKPRSAPAELIDVLISSRTVELDGEMMLLSTIRDITPRKVAERALKQSQQRLRDLQTLAGLGSWSYNLRSGEVSWSEEAFRVTGRDMSRGEPGYDEFMRLIHPDDRAELGLAIRRAVEEAASYQLTFRQQDDQGSYRTLLTRGQPVLDENQQVVEVYGVLMSTPPAPGV